MSDYLFEIGTQELPASAINYLNSQMLELFQKNCRENYLNFTDITNYSTPRRLAIIIQNLTVDPKKNIKEVKGPLQDNCYNSSKEPSPALLGFMKKYNLNLNDIVFKCFNNHNYATAQINETSCDLKYTLAQISLKVLASLNCERPMRWGNSKIKFQRPIAWLLALLDSEIINIELEDLKSSNITFGHSLLANKAIVVDKPENYCSLLKAANVIACQLERKEKVLEQLNYALKTIGANSFQSDKSLLEEVVNLVENPIAIVASFDKSFLKLPQLLITTIMIHHQRYFPVFDEAGKLLPNFIIISNNTNINASENTIKGNERVIRARLSDGSFFYQEDQKVNVTTLNTKLNFLTFQDELGSYTEKINRLQHLSRKLNNYFNDKTFFDKLTQSIELCKLDLTTNMVRELPELQGIVASWYAYGQDAEILTALAEHYKPLSNDDSLPSTTLGKTLALLDKLDNIVSFFVIGKKPTSSSDPYALRRQGQGIVDIMIELSTLFNKSIDIVDLLEYNFELVSNSVKFPKLKEKVLNSQVKIKHDLVDFFNQRIKTSLTDSKYNLSLIEAVEEIYNPLNDYHGFIIRLNALTNIINSNQDLNIIKCGIRVANIVDYKFVKTVNNDLFTNKNEIELWQSFNKNIVNKWDNQNNFQNSADINEFLISFKILVEPIENFFNGVMVNDQDTIIKTNRHSILAMINKYFLKIANFKKLQSIIPLLLFFFVISSANLVLAFNSTEEIPAASLKIPALSPENSISTYVPSNESTGKGLAVNLIYPLKSRYKEGAPIAVVVAGGNSASGLNFTTHSSQQGFIEVRFAYPGGGVSVFQSGGIYDNRGLSCQKALVDILKFAAGKIKDYQGHFIDEILPVKPLTSNLGVLAWGNGGNLACIAMTNLAKSIPFTSWLSLYECPIGDLFSPPNLGSQDEFIRNNHYHLGSAATGKSLIDFNNLSYDPNAIRYNRKFFKGHSRQVKNGVIFYDENHNGKFDESSEYAYNYNLDTGLDKQIYPPELCLAFEKKNIFKIAQEFKKLQDQINSDKEKQIDKPKLVKQDAPIKTISPAEIAIPVPKNNINYHEPDIVKQYTLSLSWPKQIALANEAIEFYKMRNASIYLPQLCVNMPSLLVMIVATVLDHKQIQEDHPHIVLQYNALLDSKPLWLKLNPEPIYISKIANMSARTFPNNKPLISLDAENINDYLEPEGLVPDYVYTEASISELADRIMFKNLSSPLKETLLAKYTKAKNQPLKKPLK